MNFLPKDIEKIIIDYKNDLEHCDKFSKSLKIIKNIKYYIETPTPEECEYNVNTTLIRWRENGSLEPNNVYPYSLSYCYKNKSIRRLGAREVTYYYSFNQLVVDDYYDYLIIECNELFMGFF